MNVFVHSSLLLCFFRVFIGHLLCQKLFYSWGHSKQSIKQTKIPSQRLSYWVEAMKYKNKYIKYIVC